MYLAQNTLQAASVRFACAKQTEKTGGKALWDFSPISEEAVRRFLFFIAVGDGFPVPHTYLRDGKPVPYEKSRDTIGVPGVEY